MDKKNEKRGCRRMVGKYPDDQQLFVSNLPSTLTEDELRNQFSQFGNVVDACISTRPFMNKTQFGFVIYEEPAAVDVALKGEPIKYTEERTYQLGSKKDAPYPKFAWGWGRRCRVWKESQPEGKDSAAP